jgi:hypothetical protein
VDQRGDPRRRRGAISVYFGPNTPFAPVTKFILAALSAVLTLLASVISDGISPAEWLQLVLAGLAAIGVYAVPNDDAASLSSPGHAI